MATQTIDIRVVDKTGQSLNNINKRLQGLQSSLGGVSRLANLATAALATIGGVNLIKGTVNTIRKFEDLSAQLTTVTGSARLASVALGEIQKFASETPFTVDEVTSAFVILKRNGIDATTESLRSFGNIAAANGKSFTQFGEAVADALTGEFERLKEFGIKVTKDGDKFVANLGNQQLGVANSTTELIDLIKQLGDEGGKFGKGIENRAKTLSGALSNLQDNVDKVTVAFGEGGARPALTEFVKTISSMVAAAEPLARQLGEDIGFALFKVTTFIKETNFNFEQFIQGAKIAVAVLGGAGLVKVLTSVTSGVKALTLAMARNPIGLIAVAAASAITYLSMENGLGRTIAQVSAVMNKLGEVFSAVGQYVKDSFLKILDKVTKAFDFVVDSIIDFINATAEFLGFEKIILSTSRELRGELADLAVEGYNAVSTAVVETTNKVVDYVSQSDLAKAAAEASSGIMGELTKAYTDAGLSYDEATAKARENYNAMVEANSVAKEVPATQAEVQAAMGATANETQKATDAFKKFREQINYTDPKELIKSLEATEQSLRAGIKLQTQDLAYYQYRNTLISNNRILFLSAEEEMYNAKAEYMKRLDELETNAMRRKMENYVKEKGAIRDLTNFQLSERERGILQNIGGQEKLQGIINDRIEFEKKSEMEKYQFGIQQAGEFFTALGTANKKAFEAAKAFNIANAIMNTYAGATKALATYPPPFNFIAAAAVVASGLAQVSAIRSQQYTGRQRGGALQIGQGTVVGEDGPEIIVPKQPGTVIPREVAEAIQGMGNRGNENVIVNFNISTVDAEGFDELLIQRRGTITGIINQALQKRGKQGVV